jgi:hypothetical protein
MSTDSERYVMLRGGLTVPVAPVLLLLDLESRGFTLSHDGEDILVSPFSKLSEDDKRHLTLWKRHVIALLSYEPPESV